MQKQRGNKSANMQNQKKMNKLGASENEVRQSHLPKMPKTQPSETKVTRHVPKIQVFALRSNLRGILR